MRCGPEVRAPVWRCRAGVVMRERPVVRLARAAHPGLTAFSGIRFHCDRCCRSVKPLAMLNGSAGARDLLAAKGYDTSATKLACYSG